MYIDSLTIAAIVVFVFAMGMFIKNCLMNSCILEADRKGKKDHTTQAGEK